MKAEAENIERRLQKFFRYPSEKERHGAVRRDEVPVAIDREGGEGLARREHEIDRPAARRRALIEKTWAEDGAYADPAAASNGHDGIDKMTAAVHERFPGARFQRTSAVDFGVVAKDGRLASDVLSGGRLNMGVGTGSQSAEFTGMGADFEGRRAAYDAGLSEICARWQAASGGVRGPEGMNVPPVQVPPAHLCRHRQG